SEAPKAILSHELKLAGTFIEGILELRGVRVVGPAGPEGRVGVVSLDFQGLDNAEIAYQLESRFGIMTRCGLHCAPLAHRTLKTYPGGTVRFTFGYFNTLDETEYAIESIKSIL
ncbi:MAG: aminotransferase class V-fold PLP-dependent enzyme, partial [Anaerovoracaceae bacterium]|nr:aminotransferase class V-fold PLP-dependent enzyme [Anaerovoracaceae bacterium]